MCPPFKRSELFGRDQHVYEILVTAFWLGVGVFAFIMGFVLDYSWKQHQRAQRMMQSRYAEYIENKRKGW